MSGRFQSPADLPFGLTVAEQEYTDRIGRRAP
jgi:hypothetical protein